MPSFVTAIVAAITSERPGIQRVELDNGRLAYVLTQLIGTVAVGDRVVVNTTAVELGLGTGGWDVVHWNLERSSWSDAGPGHIMKLRYTSLQVDTGSAEATTGNVDLGGRPVVACALQSQVACVAAAYHHLAPERRLAYVMTDSASLPIALSDLVHDLRRTGLLASTVTCGHAFGGDLEAVNLHSALALADGDAIVVGPGPGVVGTASALGFSGVEVAVVIDATVALNGRPIVAVRYSDADPRDRHRGVSHHTTTALALASHPAVAPTPAEVDVPDVAALLAGRGIRITSMGRSPAEDPMFFQYAGAAGVAAAQAL